MDLAVPEFEGLWDQHKPYKVPKDAETSLKLPNGSKMEKVGAFLKFPCCFGPFTSFGK